MWRSVAVVASVAVVLAGCGGGEKPTYGQVKSVVKRNPAVKRLCPGGVYDVHVKGSNISNLQCSGHGDNRTGFDQGNVFGLETFSTEKVAQDDARGRCVPDPAHGVPGDAVCLVSGRTEVVFTGVTRPFTAPGGAPNSRIDLHVANELARAVKRDCGCGRIVNSGSSS